MEEELINLDNMARKRKSLSIFKHDGMVRMSLLIIIEHRFFEYTMLLIIIASTVQLAIDNPLNNPQSTLSQGL